MKLLLQVRHLFEGAGFGILFEEIMIQGLYVYIDLCLLELPSIACWDQGPTNYQGYLRSIDRERVEDLSSTSTRHVHGCVGV